ncbi:MFS transporter [Cypionkella sp.]|uniref:MFS transporter n=1 Tax=Cypionkella sp. TaxID=2811411 RepID=UPI002FDE8A24
MTDRLWPWSLFAALIAAAGLPIYINAPKVYVDDYGVSLASLGVVLGLLRLVDVVQDPFFGGLVDRLGAWREAAVGVAAAILALSMLGLFAVTPPLAPLAWFALMMLPLFSAYSFLSIAFYAQGVARAQSVASGHIGLAGWRETGSLIGVCLAAVAPVALAGTGAPFPIFAAGFATLALLAVLAMRGQWRGSLLPQALPFRAALRQVTRDAPARRLLVLALINAAPVAVTSTLFLFYVESVLQRADAAGPLLLLFFLSAAVSAPIFSNLGQRFGERPVLLAAMALAVASFVWAYSLGAGQIFGFALITAASGAALGADMVLLPALFARRLAQIGGEGAGFGLWAFASKLSLALAAAVLLPLLQAGGFASGVQNTPQALALLTLLYAGVPCGLKLVAMALLARMPIEKEL